MLLKITNLHKSIGLKELFENLSLSINEGEKVALIGRNGLGKTTLFKIITGEDMEFQGDIEIKKNIKIILTRQEHFFKESITALDYILDHVPNYRELKSYIKKREETLGTNIKEIEEYTDAITKFSEIGYYDIEERILQSLEDFDVNIDKALGPMESLSGGEKRFVELVRVMYSNADLALIDEPTNHMDYVGKAAFIKWLNTTKQTIFVITHDRDVLNNVDRIIELKEKKMLSFEGNYDNYLKQNSNETVSKINSYETDLKKIEKAKKQMLTARNLKFKAKGKKGRVSARIREERFKREYENLADNLNKPSFWIDQESKEEISDKVIEKYDRYKEKNITISANNSNEHKKLLLKISKLSVGYDKPLFENINFELFHGDRVFIKGRNGAGKSTLVKAIIKYICQENHQQIEQRGGLRSNWGGHIIQGEVKFSSSLKIGVYEQEVNPKYLDKSLSDAIIDVYTDQGLPINLQKVQNILGSYLFDPRTDATLTFNKLSGGQKARFQIIKMLSNNPNLLILDEPTNHLDLPSIEELENTLLNYHGAILYISHDNYLIRKLGGKVVEI